MKHYSEAELLETYYMQPGQSAPTMLHLAACDDCSARFNRLEAKMRAAAAASCPTEKPETFWSRQRLSIMHRIAAEPRRAVSIIPALRIAAAVILAFVLGGAVVYKHMAPSVAKPVPQKPPVVAITETIQPAQQQQQQLQMQGRIDPWESEQLRDFHAMVEWESWVPEAHQLEGDDTL